MNIPKSLLATLIMYFLSFSNVFSNVDIEENSASRSATQNENLLAHCFLYTGWLTPQEIMLRNHDELRNTLISFLDDRCNTPIANIMALDDNNLTWSSLMYFFLQEKVAFTPNQLLNMSLEDYRNTVITINSQNTSLSVSQLQAFNNAKNLNVAYNWWFTKNADFSKKISSLKNISTSYPRFDIKDNRGKNLDVLRITLANETAYKYLSVYHYQVNSNGFVLALAGSNNLINWTFITSLGERSHQGDIKKWGNGYLLVNEQDIIEGSNNIRVRYFANYQSLITNNATNDITIARKFSTFAEGTPDIRAIIGDNPSTSHIVLGFHYYDNGVKDQLATGILLNFNDWRAWKNDISNYNTLQLGFNGNIGGRSSFFHNSSYVLQEAQITPNDWSSWRILLGDGAFYSLLSPITSKASLSFANPGIADLGSGNFAVSMFMPTEGNQIGERGELLYQVNFSEPSTSALNDNNTDLNNNSIKIISDKNQLTINNAQDYEIKVYNFLGILIESIDKATNPQQIAARSSVIIKLTKNNKHLILKHIGIN